MSEYTTHTQTASELDTALNQLELALVDAGRSMAVVRRNVAQLTSLVDVVRELELAMSRARESLAAAPSVTITEQVSPQPLRPVPQPPIEPYAPPEASYAPPAPIAQPETYYEAPAAEPDLERTPEEQPSLEYAAEEPAAEAGQPASHCLLLGVASKIGSLDLKAVDGSVNENPAVVDVALLDYDGRKASLKLWINGAADPAGVRDALLGSLRRRLGDEDEAEVQIEFESAA